MKRRGIDIVADGKRLEACWVGPGPHEAPTLVFLHEGLGCVGLWKDFPERLAAATGCGALIYSRAGDVYLHSLKIRKADAVAGLSCYRTSDD